MNVITDWRYLCIYFKINDHLLYISNYYHEHCIRSNMKKGEVHVYIFCFVVWA